MSTRISSTSAGVPPTLIRSNTTASSSMVQVQLRRSISVENENGAATLALLAALVKKSNCNVNDTAKNPISISQPKPPPDGSIVTGELDTSLKYSSSLNSKTNFNTGKDFNFPNIVNQKTQQQQKIEKSSILGSTTIQTNSTGVIHTTSANLSTFNNSNNNIHLSNVNNTVKSSAISQNLHHQIPSDILDDLASRFIINTPVNERSNLIRICFQIELAHWFYLDFFCGNEDKKLIPCGLKQFALHLFQHIPFLRNFVSGIDKILEDWKEYKLSVPTYGAILVSEDLKNVLLVQSYWAKSSWGFPKGKINEHEDPVHCATREVYEETGFDITDMIVPEHYIECVINYQYTRLYIIHNVRMTTTFSPRTRKEIKCCEWFPLDSLPTTKNDPNCKSQLGINANSFFMIIPFMKRLKKWINDNRSGIDRKYSSTSPITTFNNNSGCGNFYANNNTSNYNNNGILKQQQQPLSTKKNNNSNGDKKIGISTTNNNNSNSSNCNQSNNQKNKRQRHKSMGDIDGIKLKLNFMKNNGNMMGSNNNRLQQQQIQQQQQSSNNCNIPIKINGNKNKEEDKDFFFEDNSKYSNGVKHINSKRQLFSCISSDGNLTNDKNICTNNNNNGNKKDKEKNYVNNNSTNNNKNGGNCVRSRTKSLGQHTNNNLQQSIHSNGVQRKNSNENKEGGIMRKKSSHNIQVQQQQQMSHQNEQQKHHRNNQQQQQQNGGDNYNNSHSDTTIIDNQKTINNNINRKNYIFMNNCTTQQRQFMKLKQQHDQLKAVEQQLQEKNSPIKDNFDVNNHTNSTDNLKFNPNFDSWTNFSFTKNFIANVFC